MKIKEYFLYSHTRDDNNEIFYIGVGSINKKHKYKRAFQKDTRNSFWKDIVKITTFSVKILQESFNLKELEDEETRLIALYGKIKYGTGTLANITDGGHGTNGYIPSLENREKHSIRMIGTKATKDTKDKMSKSQLNKVVPKSVGIKISNSKKGKKPGGIHYNKPTKVKNKTTGIVYDSLTQAAKSCNMRRNTLSAKLKNNEECDFEYY